MKCLSGVLRQDTLAGEVEGLILVEVALQRGGLGFYLLVGNAAVVHRVVIVEVVFFVALVFIFKPHYILGHVDYWELLRLPGLDDRRRFLTLGNHQLAVAYRRTVFVLLIAQTQLLLLLRKLFLAGPLFLAVLGGLALFVLGHRLDFGLFDGEGVGVLGHFYALVYL